MSAAHATRPIAILYEDEHLLVVDKPAGVLSVPELSERLARQGVRALPVHRLDRDVSGALLCARGELARAELESLFRERALRKIYWALARGIVQPAQGSFKFPLLEEHSHARVSARGKPSETRFRTLASWKVATEVEIELVTGRKNQIRVHFAHAGFPLIGERKYARGAEDPLRAKRVALHAWRLEFGSPWGGAQVRVESPLPAELATLRARAAG